MTAVLASSLSPATVAPRGQTVFNLACPAKRLCPEIERHYRGCLGRHDQQSCATFVTLFRQLVAEYDCQRPFDHTHATDYIVPEALAAYKDTAQVRKQFLKGNAQAATGIVVHSLLRKGMLIEIDAIAVLDG